MMRAYYLIVACVTALAMLPQNPAPTPSPSPVPILTTPKADVTLFGAKAQVGFDNAPAFQLAHDTLVKALASAPFGQRGSIHVPPALAAYDFASPLYLDYHGIDLESDGGGATLRSGMLSAGGVTFVGCPAVVVGYRRPSTIGGAYAGSFSNYRPDCFGRLDVSLGPVGGHRWGFRTNGNASIIAHGSPFSHGARSPSLGGDYLDNWAETSTLTIELAVEGFSAGGLIAPNSFLAGVGDEQQHVFPYSVRTAADGSFLLVLQTQATRFGPLVSTVVSGIGKQAPGVQRLAIQIDLNRGNLTVWLNGIQQYTGALPSNCKLAENDDWPFQVGISGMTAGVSGQVSGDFALYGYSMSKTLRYKLGTNGSIQVRNADLLPYSKVFDSYRYSDDGTDRSGLIGYFAFSEPPNAAQPMLSIPSPSSISPSSPAFIAYNGTGAMGFLGSTRIKNLNIQATRPYGTALMLGQVIQFGIRDCDISGGMWAMATLPMGSNYPITAEDCNFSSSGDAAFYLYGSIARLVNCDIASGGRATMRIHASSLAVNNMFIAGCNLNAQWSVLRQHIEQGLGGAVSLTNIIQDVEGAPFPSRGAIGLESGPDGGSVRLTDVNGGLTPGVPFMVLGSPVAPSPTWPVNMVVTQNSTSYQASSQAVAMVPGWTVNGSAVPVTKPPVVTPVGLKGKR